MITTTMLLVLGPARAQQLVNLSKKYLGGLGYSSQHACEGTYVKGTGRAACNRELACEVDVS